MFLRKVSWEFPDSVIKELWDIDFGHVYPMLHNQYKVKLEKDELVTINEKNDKSSLLSQFIQLRKQNQFGINLVLLFIIFVFINLL
jgi:hypothetical protein